MSVEIRSLSYSYPSGGRVIEDLTLSLHEGARAALVGATGSGKSTLAKLMARFADPASGAVAVGGFDLRTVDPDSLRARVLLVPQEGFLFATTVGENVAFARAGATEDDVRGAFESLGLDDWVAGLPDGLDTTVGERGEHLSFGERQLVALARAALASPGLLVLDEATSALDPATEVRVGRALERLAAGRTSVTVAHRLSTAARAEVVLVMEAGRLVEIGSHDELVARGGHYAELYERWLSIS